MSNYFEEAVRKGHFGEAQKIAEQLGLIMDFKTLKIIFCSCFDRGWLDEAREVALKMEEPHRSDYLQKVIEGDEKKEKSSDDCVFVKKYRKGYIELELLDDAIETYSLLSEEKKENMLIFRNKLRGC